MQRFFLQEALIEVFHVSLDFCWCRSTI